MKYYKPCQLKVLSEVNLALCDANECTNSDLCVCFESIKIFHATGILKKFFPNFSALFRSKISKWTARNNHTIR